MFQEIEKLKDAPMIGLRRHTVSLCHVLFKGKSHSTLSNSEFKDIISQENVGAQIVNQILPHQTQEQAQTPLTNEIDPINVRVIQPLKINPSNVPY